MADATTFTPATDEGYLSSVRPTDRQLRWQQLEFYGFIHFGVNTMTDREWGDGTEDPAIFDPVDLDADEWVRLCKEAGMRALILTCKHHDGFALWPTRYSEHSVASSPWRGGRGDVVREVSDACRRHGLRFGVYLSPWDRHEPTYGSGTAYDDFYVAQLTELLTGYGEIACVWLDGACGEGPSGRRQVYDWERYYRVVRALQPEAVISVCGPDVRWCGNEAGETREDEWSVVPFELRDAERTASLSQQQDDGRFSRRGVTADADLGSREALEGYRGELVWYPSEVNTSTRPGWFHHDAEDAQVRPAEELFDIYRRSVGGNATFLLNVPPRRDGRISEADARSLRGLGALIADWQAADIAPTAVLRASSSGGTADPTARGLEAEPWSPAVDDEAPWLELSWREPVRLRGIAVGEDVAQGQRIERMVVTATTADGAALPLGEVRSVGMQRILDLPDVLVTGVRCTFPEARGVPSVKAYRAIASVRS